MPLDTRKLVSVVSVGAIKAIAMPRKHLLLHFDKPDTEETLTRNCTTPCKSHRSGQTICYDKRLELHTVPFLNWEFKRSFTSIASTRTLKFLGMKSGFLAGRVSFF